MIVTRMLIISTAVLVCLFVVFISSLGAKDNEEPTLDEANGERASLGHSACDNDYGEDML